MPCTALHWPLAQFAGVVGGIEAAHWESVVQGVVPSGPPSALPVADVLPLELLHEPVHRAMAMAHTPVTETQLLRCMLPAPLAFVPLPTLTPKEEPGRRSIAVRDRDVQSGFSTVTPSMR
jgi:hypothetical protein